MILSLRYRRNAVIIRFSLQKKGLMALSGTSASALIRKKLTASKRQRRKITLKCGYRYVDGQVENRSYKEP